MLFDDNDQAKHKADYQYDGVPPPRSFSVVLGHMRMVWVVEFSFLRVLESFDDVATPKDHDVCNEGTNLGRSARDDQRT